MYSYNFNKEENKIVLEDANGKVLEANISVVGNVAKASFVYIKEIETSSLFSLVSNFCTESKTLLASNGINVDKVVCSGLLGTSKYDEIYEKMNEELVNKNTSRINKR